MKKDLANLGCYASLSLGYYAIKILYPIMYFSQMLRRKPVSKACDVYSFGIILWELLTRKAFSDISPTFVPSKVDTGG